MRNGPKDFNDKPEWDLVPLTPEYLEAEHRGYVSALETAIKNDEIRNIALSGSYGVGKSSILRELGKRLGGRVVELSLSTLAPIEDVELDKSVPIQAATPTNRIQQEIVKQLLYREAPGKTPASRFRRIESFPWLREFGIAVLLGFAIAILSLFVGGTARLIATFTALSGLGSWLHMIVWGIAGFLVLAVRWLFYGKLRITHLSAGAATVTLDENAVSYFDQYLDEIVYFFEASGRDVVIFEDIDRFDDSNIFDTLRALNTLLNASPQIKKTIRFIYAIKDSIFDWKLLEEAGRKLEKAAEINDPAQAEAMRANRTKFFDLVIPVVPFITHRSARNLAIKLLEGIDHKVAPELLDIAAQYVPDMRLLKNVRNEFIIFRDQIFSGGGEKLGLSETDLFAMMLYKSTHLADFEKTRFGQSNLDTLYRLSRQLVAENIKRIEGERHELEQRRTRITGAETRSARLGEKLLLHVQRVVDLVGYSRQYEAYEFEGEGKSAEDLKSAQFWTSFVTADDPVLLWSSNYYHGQNLRFTRSYLSAELNDPLDAEAWVTSARETLEKQIDKKIKDVEFLRGADLGDLMRHPEFQVTYKNAERSIASLAEELLKPGLAYELMRAGYLNRNFTLYTSTFHGDRVSSAAMNFIIHHVERNQMDAYFQLTQEDAATVVRECGRDALKEPRLYNINILDYLLDADINAADIMIESLAVLGEEQVEFLNIYLVDGKKRSCKLIERLTEIMPEMFIYLVNKADLPNGVRLKLVNAALKSLPVKVPSTDEGVANYLRAHYADFDVLAEGEQANAERIGALFAESNIVLPSLEPLCSSVLPVFISRSLYDITHENLSTAIGDKKTIALDVIRATNKTVYDYVLEHLDTYLSAAKGVSATIDAPEQFITVLKDVLAQGTDFLDDVVEHAVSACQVSDLDAIDKEIWPALAMHQRFPATFNNVSRYIEVYEVDTRLARLLTSSGAITEVAAVEEDEKARLATTILKAREPLPDAALRADLVVSLELGSCLDVEEIPAEKGDLFALLLTRDIISDTAASYKRLATTDWPTRKAFILKSAEFTNYLVPELVQQDLAAVLVDDEIRDTVKRAIVEQAADYVQEASRQELEELARLAVQYGQLVPSNAILSMAKKRLSAQYVVPLIEPHLDTLSRADLFAILQELEGDYPKLTTVGRAALRVENTPADRALLEYLKKYGTVSTYNADASPIKVNMRRKSKPASRP